MKQTIRTAAMLLALLLAGETLLSCGDTETGKPMTEEGGTAAASQTAGEETVDPFAAARAAFQEIPVSDLGGGEFVIAAQSGVGSSEDEIYIEEATGDVIEDAVYMRNLAVNERFNCKITLSAQGDVNSAVKKAVTAGDDSIRLAFPNLAGGGSLAQAGVLRNFLDFKEINLSAPWWDQGTANLTIGGKVYFMMGDINILDNDVTYILLFNKKLIADADIEEPYQLVRDGKWTIEMFGSMCRNITADIDGDGTFTEKDRYGYVTTGAGPNTFFYGSAMKYVELDAEGTPYLTTDTEKATDVLRQVVGIVKENNPCYQPTDYNVGKTIFMEDRALFYGEVLSYIINLRAMETSFGVLPIPKYDEAQKEYYTYCENNASTVVIPNVGANPEINAAVLEAMAIQSNINVTPAYYEVALERKYTRDEESTEMLDIALANRVYDIGRIYTNLGTADIFSSLVNKGSLDFVSTYTKKEKGALKALSKIVDAFASNDD
ncbi:MAG: hypothetical protein MJ175_07380 [Clostridia bacterium]|nr:hypothetical protein [Clostridia bacterium]